MLRSMTAFGRCKEIRGRLDITAEIKSVNSRYLDCTIKLPRLYSFLEDKVKASLNANGITRGKVEVNIYVEVVESSGTEYSLDADAARSYISALEALRDTFGLKDDITVSRVAQNRDLFVVRKADDDLEKDWEEINSVLTKAIEGFNAMRKAEGERLCTDILAKADGIEALAAKVKTLSEADIKTYPEKLEKKIKQFLADFDAQVSEDRILTEAAIYADKAAIDEELVRLASHFRALRDIVKSDEANGRKLDFLLQEINRETNTIGSKAGNTEISHIVVDMKTEIEKIREQIQNLE